MKIPPAGPRFATKDPPRDERVAPSLASGGIPEPTPLYTAQSMTPSSPLHQPRRIFVIMDLNGTLLYRPNKRNPFNFIQRPHAREFLDYCIDTFHVAIWSLLDIVRWIALTMTLFRAAVVGDCTPFADSNSRW